MGISPSVDAAIVLRSGTLQFGGRSELWFGEETSVLLDERFEVAILKCESKFYRTHPSLSVCRWPLGPIGPRRGARFSGGR